MARTIAFSIDGGEPILKDVNFESAKIGDWICNDSIPMGFGRIVKKDDDFITVDRNPLFEIYSDPINKDDFNNLKLKKILNAIDIKAEEIKKII